MPPLLALVLCLAFCFWMLHRDVRARPPVSAAIWIPQIYLLVRLSRPIGRWLGAAGVGSMGDPEEGSLEDRLFILALFFAALIVLARRRVNWSHFFFRNKAALLVYLYFGLSILWSDNSFVAFKRWFKECANVAILLVLLTENDPVAAIRTVFRRCAYFLLPLSVILTKYFPEFGRQYSMGGFPMVTGVTDQKNTLGSICVVLSLFMVWDVWDQFRRRVDIRDRRDAFLRLGICALALWLLYVSDSKTSLVCLLLAAVIFLTPKFPLLRRQPRLVVLASLVIIPAILTATMFYGMAPSMVEMLGRDATFTGRTAIWEKVLSFETDPWVGTGFYSFWIGERGRHAMDLAKTASAHNGYIETYLDGGYIGVALLVLLLLSSGFRLSKAFLDGTDFGRLRFAFWVALVVSNFSEVYTFRLSPLWIAWLFAHFYHSATLEPALADEEQATESMSDYVAGRAPYKSS